jgi:hypothetical protein
MTKEFFMLETILFRKLIDREAQIQCARVIIVLPALCAIRLARTFYENAQNPTQQMLSLNVRILSKVTTT